MDTQHLTWFLKLKYTSLGRWRAQNIFNCREEEWGDEPCRRLRLIQTSMTMTRIYSVLAWGRLPHGRYLGATLYKAATYKAGSEGVVSVGRTRLANPLQGRRQWSGCLWKHPPLDLSCHANWWSGPALLVTGRSLSECPPLYPRLCLQSSPLLPSFGVFRRD